MKNPDHYFWIETWSGKNFDYVDFNPEAICIEDIAHSLSQKCRFNGHTNNFYSVAQHCLNVMWNLRKKGYSHEVQLLGLLHDAAEAYISDLPSPLKAMSFVHYATLGTNEYSDFENIILHDILKTLYKSNLAFSVYVNVMDKQVLLHERDQLFTGKRTWMTNVELDPEVELKYIPDKYGHPHIEMIEDEFVNQFEWLVKRINKENEKVITSDEKS